MWVNLLALLVDRRQLTNRNRRPTDLSYPLKNNKHTSLITEHDLTHPQGALG